MRPIDDKGKWQAKTQKEYLCKRGDEEQGFTSDEFKAAQVWRFGKTISVLGWQKENLYDTLWS